MESNIYSFPVLHLSKYYANIVDRFFAPILSFVKSYAASLAIRLVKDLG